MLIRTPSFLALCLLCSCQSHQEEKATVTNIILQYAQSYTYDLQKQTFIVHNTQGDSTIPFSLLAEEWKSLTADYNQLKLFEIPVGRQVYEDDCMIMPKLYSMLTIYSSKGRQEIMVDENCPNGFWGNQKRKRILQFLKKIRELLSTKPEIKKAPKSDIMYI